MATPNWDLSQANALLNTLSSRYQAEINSLQCSEIGGSVGLGLSDTTSWTSTDSDSTKKALRTSPSTGLGDFSQIWRFLGTQPPSAQAEPETRSPTLQQRVPSHIEYTSDGAVYTVPGPAKKLQWRDQVSDNPIADVVTDDNDQDTGPRLTKKQRWKLNKRRRQHEADLTRRAASDTESEAEVPTSGKIPAIRAGIHKLRGAHHRSSPTNKLSSRPTYYTDDSDGLPEMLAEAGRRALRKYGSEPADTTSERAKNKTPEKQWPVSDPFDDQALSFLPASVGPQRQQQQRRPKSIGLDHAHPVITPKTIRSGPDRHWAFLLKLIANFYEDKASLVAPANLTNHASDPAGIHVFVDASNIFIGFHDQLKRARSIPVSTRVPRVDMSFDALSLLLERRRPVAKRVLAGSTPHLHAFDVARSIGYECSILDKVYKARELTARQRFFQARDEAASGYSSAGEAAATTTHAPHKYVEQGVDEILHLKMLESVVDADEPSTMVLATGDAAQAEYSSGFMVMVERALKKAWSVELVSWSANIAAAYRREAFRTKWGDKFRVIELDDYAEELLDM